MKKTTTVETVKATATEHGCECSWCGQEIAKGARYLDANVGMFCSRRCVDRWTDERESAPAR